MITVISLPEVRAALFSVPLLAMFFVALVTAHISRAAIEMVGVFKSWEGDPKAKWI